MGAPWDSIADSHCEQVGQHCLWGVWRRSPVSAAWNEIGHRKVKQGSGYAQSHAAARRVAPLVHLPDIVSLRELSHGPAERAIRSLSRALHKNPIDFWWTTRFPC